MTDYARGSELHKAGDLDGAEQWYRAALHAHDPRPELRYDFAVLLMQTGRAGEAAELLQQEAADGRLDGGGRVLLAFCLDQAHGPAHAYAAARQATDHAPAMPMAWLVRGKVEVRLGRYDAASSSLRRCVSLAPGVYEAWHYLGEALQAQRRWREAADAYARAAVAQPGEALNIAICMEMDGDFAAARAGYQRMHELRPDLAACTVRLAQLEARMCELEATEQHARLVDAQLVGAGLADDDLAEPFALTFLPVSWEAKRRALAHHSARVLKRVTGLPAPRKTGAGTGSGPIRIGYISPDFGDHAVGTLLRGVPAAHDRDRFRVFGYSLRRHADGTAERLRNGFDCFRDCEGMPAADLARQIAEDDIAVLIDLGGYTHGARPEVLALRPAPVQLGWMGFIDGQLAPWLDAIILDEHVLPRDMPWPFEDRVIRMRSYMLPGGEAMEAAADRARFDLPPGVPLFASFNNSYKLDLELLQAWVAILERAPTAHLALYLPEYARPGFLRSWTRHGGGRDRLHLLGPVPLPEQLARAASCDLFLDAFRYQAGATGVSSVAAGLPLLSRTGTTPLSNLGAGLNRFLGLHELACADTHEYIERAVSLANDPGALAHVRRQTGAAVRASGLLDPRRVAAEIEDIACGELEKAGVAN